MRAQQAAALRLAHAVLSLSLRLSLVQGLPLPLPLQRQSDTLCLHSLEQARQRRAVAGSHQEQGQWQQCVQRVRHQRRLCCPHYQRQWCCLLQLQMHRPLQLPHWQHQPP